MSAAEQSRHEGAVPAPSSVNPVSFAESLTADRLNEAEAEFVLALEYNPHYAEAVNGLGLIAYRRGQLDRARDHFREAIVHNDDFAEAHGNLGVILLETGKHRDAETALRAAARIEPDDEGIRANLARAYNAHGVAPFSGSYLSAPRSVWNAVAVSLRS